MAPEAQEAAHDRLSQGGAHGGASVKGLQVERAALKDARQVRIRRHPDDGRHNGPHRAASDNAWQQVRLVKSLDHTQVIQA